MKWKFNKKILVMPIVMSSAFLLVACTQNAHDKNSLRKHIEKIKEQFADMISTKLKQFYPVEWKINDEVAIDQLGINPPILSGGIDVSYFVKNILLGTGIVDIEIKFFHERQHIDSKIITVHGFKNSDEIDQDIDQILEQIASEYEIESNDLASEVMLKIEDFLDLQAIELNDGKVSIDSMKPDNQRGWIELQIKVEKSGRFKTKTILIKGFQINDETTDQAIKDILKKIPSEQEIVNNMLPLPSHFDGQLDSFLELRNIDLSHVDIHLEAISCNDEQGFIEAKIKVTKSDRSHSKMITFKGFKTINKLFQEIYQYASSFTKNNAFDLKEFVTNLHDEKWLTLLHKFIDYSNNKFDIKVLNMIKWKISNDENTIWNTPNLDSVFSTFIMFELENNQKKYTSDWIEFHFKNMKLDPKERKIYQEKTKLEKYLLKKIISEFFEEKTAASLKATFGNQVLTCEQIETNFGIQFEQTTKENVEITGKITSVFENKDDGATKIIAIDLVIKQADLFVKISSPLWIVFKR